MLSFYKKFFLVFLCLSVCMMTELGYAKSNKESFVKSYAPLNPSLLLTYNEFSKLTEKKRQVYISDVQQAFLKFEQSLPDKLRQQKNQKNAWFQLFAPRTAHALDRDNRCVIGGMAGVKHGKLCSTIGNSCPAIDGNSDTFKCGKIYGNACVLRKDIKDLSARCHEAGKNVTLSKENYEGDYEEFRKTLDNIVNTLCVQPKDPEPCSYLVAKINQKTNKARESKRKVAQTPPKARTVPDSGGKCVSVRRKFKGKPDCVSDPYVGADNSFLKELRIKANLCQKGAKPSGIEFNAGKANGVVYLGQNDLLCVKLTPNERRFRSRTACGKRNIDNLFVKANLVPLKVFDKNGQPSGMLQIDGTKLTIKSANPSRFPELMTVDFTANRRKIELFSSPHAKVSGAMDISHVYCPPSYTNARICKKQIDHNYDLTGEYYSHILNENSCPEFGSFSMTTYPTVSSNPGPTGAKGRR